MFKRWITFLLDESLSSGFPNTYPLESDLSRGQCYPMFEQLAPDAIDFPNLLEGPQYVFRDTGIPLFEARDLRFIPFLYHF